MLAASSLRGRRLLQVQLLCMTVSLLLPIQQQLLLLLLSLSLWREAVELLILTLLRTLPCLTASDSTEAALPQLQEQLVRLPQLLLESERTQLRCLPGFGGLALPSAAWPGRRPTLAPVRQAEGLKSRSWHPLHALQSGNAELALALHWLPLPSLRLCRPWFEHKPGKLPF